MKKGFLATILMACLALALCITACSKKEEAPAADTAADEATTEEATTETTEATVDGSAYGYAGTDPVEAAVYKYMVEEVSKDYEKTDVSIPIVQIVSVDDSNPDEVIVRGDFWINNYNINGDTLECVSGGNYPGVMHVTKSGDEYVVSAFDKVADGAGFDDSAKELFGDDYDALVKVMSDDTARAEQRTATVSDYVKLNGLSVTQYKDYGWDPVQLDV